MIEDAQIGALAAALAKAQAEFPAIVRDKEVDSRSYKFKYADLSSVIAAVRPALGKNGLAIVQLLDGDDLVTMLLHESGATLSGRVNLPREGTIQQFGSAVTYIRRYALQAILGVAAEEDDDGEAAAKLKAAPRRERFLSDREAPTAEPTTAFDAGLVGFAEIGKGDADFGLRQTTTKLPDGGFRDGWTLAFRLSEKPKGRAGTKVIALDALAELIAEYRPGIEDQRVTCWGSVSEETFTPAGSKPVTYSVLNLSRLKVGALDLSAPDHEPTEDEDALIEQIGDAMDAARPTLVPAV